MDHIIKKIKENKIDKIKELVNGIDRKRWVLMWDNGEISYVDLNLNEMIVYGIQDFGEQSGDPNYSKATMPFDEFVEIPTG